MKMTKTLGLGAIVAIAAVLATDALAKERTTGRGTGPVVYVESQGLFYDSIVVANLPARGRFQQLIPSEQFGLKTEFGPGNVGYLGGRWWLDTNGDDMMDDGDAYFLCPLLGPGRGTP